MAYFKRGALVERFQSIVTAGGTTTLTSSSRTYQMFTGTQSQTVILPDATTCDGGSNNTGGTKFVLVNRSTLPVYVNTNGGARRLVLNAMSSVMLTLADDTSAAGVWRSFVADPEQQPLKMSAAEVPDANIYISANIFLNPDGTDTNTPPLSNLVPVVPASSHNLQTGVTSGATFNNAAIPATTIGNFRRVGYTLLPTGTIQVLYSAEAASIGALANPGTVFSRTGLPIGWIDVEASAANSFKTAGSATNVVENMVGTDVRVHRFGTGGGGGGGTGDTTEFLEEVKERLRNPENRLYTPEWVTPVIFSETGEDFIDSSTGTFNVVNSSYQFTAIGQNASSTQMLDTRFLESDEQVFSVDFLLDWIVYDPLATYEVSFNGGTNWTAFTTERVSTESGRVFGSMEVTPTGAAAFVEYPVSNADNTRALDLGARQEYSFRVPASTDKRYLQDLIVYFNKAGSPLGNLYVDIMSDNAGNIGPDIYAQSTFSVSAMSAGNNALTLSVGQTYYNKAFWVRFSTDQAYKNSFVSITSEIRVRVDGSTPTYAGGDSRQFNGTVWSADTGNSAVFSFSGFNYDLRWRVTAGTANVEMGNVAIFYGRLKLSPGGAEEVTETHFFDASTNPTTFTMTRFLPNHLLKVYDSYAGQVYTYGSFTIQGSDVIFPADTFLGTGTVKLIFDMHGAGGYDNSDVNASLMAENGLGSSDPAIDKSLPDVGVKTRASDGVLYETVVMEGGMGLIIREVV